MHHQFPGWRDLGQRLSVVARQVFSIACQFVRASVSVLLLQVLPAAGQSGDFSYTTTNHTITITGYAGPGGAVTIPSSIDGMLVTGIGAQAFYYQTRLTSIRIPGTVGLWGMANFPGMSGSWAFAGCTGLTNVTVDEGVQEIPEYVFQNCPGIVRISLPDSLLRIRAGAFSPCSSLVDLTLGTNLAIIDSTAFGGCSSLVNLTLPQNLKTLGAYSFGGCSSLLYLRIPDAVENVDDGAFSECSALTNVVIGKSVTTLSDFSFSAGFNLTAIDVDPLNATYSSLDGVLLDKLQTRLILWPMGKAGGYRCPPTVTCIEGGAFDGCTGLVSVLLTDSVTNIGPFAFANTRLTRFAIPDSVTNLGQFVFGNCTTLTNVTLGSHVVGIGDGAFNGCTNLIAVFFRGNAPILFFSIFDGDNNATIYYLPGTTGWSSTFSGQPAVLWNPQFQTADPSFGVRNRCFQFHITGTPDIPIVLESCPDLLHPEWLTLQSCTLTNGSILFRDSGWTGSARRFYRVRSP